jgi:squalene-associated FAD-dependent desaturase
VVGAGLAGLAAAISLAEAGVEVALYEAAPQAGGRCRSYLDTSLGCRIDNGNHLLLSGNHAAQSYLGRIGAADSLIGPVEAAFPFLDIASGERWVLRPNKGRLPWWLLRPGRRVPGTRATDYLRLAGLLRAQSQETLGERITEEGVLYRRLVQPLAVAMLNTEIAEGSAALFGAVLRESLLAGGGACRPLVPREGLSESFVGPALRRLSLYGTACRFGARLRAMAIGESRIEKLEFDGETIPLDANEAVVLAVTAPVAARLVPQLAAPEAFRAIVNAHYRVALSDTAPLFVGLVGGLAEWVFRKREVLSVTVSAADRLIDQGADDLAQTLWRDVVKAYDLQTEALPAWQIVKERRATFAATPAQARRRPPAKTGWDNLVLAGDWTDTGLPATIEGAIRSGFTAAEALGAVPRKSS